MARTSEAKQTLFAWALLAHAISGEKCSNQRSHVRQRETIPCQLGPSRTQTLCYANTYFIEKSHTLKFGIQRHTTNNGADMLSQQRTQITAATKSHLNMHKVSSHRGPAICPRYEWGSHCTITLQRRRNLNLGRKHERRSSPCEVRNIIGRLEYRFTEESSFVIPSLYRSKFLNCHTSKEQELVQPIHLPICCGKTEND